MAGTTSFALEPLDFAAFLTYFVVPCAIGLWAGRKEKSDSGHYFLAGKTLPWYVVGSSFIASNISIEHFVGMIGAAFLYGICVATSEWLNVLSFSVLIWFFIPFLLASRVLGAKNMYHARMGIVLSGYMKVFMPFIVVVPGLILFAAGAPDILALDWGDHQLDVLRRDHHGADCLLLRALPLRDLS
jgi:SSS family solute:Na+ symporter